MKQQKRRHRVDFYETPTFPILILQSVLAMSVSKGFDCDCEYMKIIYVKSGLRDEYESDPHSNEHYLSNSENKA